MRIKKKSTIIIWCLVVVSSICLWNVISIQPYYSDIQAYIKKLHSNPNDKDIAKEFLKFIEEITRIS